MRMISCSYQMEWQDLMSRRPGPSRPTAMPISTDPATSRHEVFANPNVHSFLAGADVSDALQQFVEVVRNVRASGGGFFSRRLSIVKPFTLYSLNLSVAPAGITSPVAIAPGSLQPDRVQVVMFNQPRDRTLTFASTIRNFRIIAPGSAVTLSSAILAFAGTYQHFIAAAGRMGMTESAARALDIRVFTSDGFPPVSGDSPRN